MGGSYSCEAPEVDKNDKEDVTQSHISYRALVAAFRQVDADGSGNISPKEMEHFLRYLGLASEAKYAQSTFFVMDSNGDNKIDLDEWLEGLPNHLKKLIVEKTDRKGALEGFQALRPLTDVFAQFDTDDSGYLSKSELLRALRCLGYESASEVMQVVHTMDANKDGEIDIEEWKEKLPDEVRQTIEANLTSEGLVENFIDDGSDRPIVRALFDDLEELDEARNLEYHDPTRYMSGHGPDRSDEMQSFRFQEGPPHMYQQHEDPYHAAHQYDQGQYQQQGQYGQDQYHYQYQHQYQQQSAW